MKKAPPVVTDHEVKRAVDYLRENSHGMNKAQRERMFGSDRHGRAVLAEIVCRSIAVVVNDEQPGLGSVMRLARTEAERERELASIRSRIQQLRRREYGLETGPIDEPRVPQKALFE